MSKKLTIFIISLIAVILILSVITAIFYVTGTAYFDPYTTVEDDFLIPTPALTEEAEVCQTITLEFRRRWETTCEDSKWKTFSQRFQTGGVLPLHGSSRVHAEDGQLILSSQASMKAEATYLKDLKNNDIKLKADLSMSSQPQATEHITTIEFYLGETLLFSDNPSIRPTDYPRGESLSKSYLIEFSKDFEEPSLFYIILDGEEVDNVLVSDEEAYLKMKLVSGTSTKHSASLKINYLKSKPYESCDLQEDEAIWTGRYDSGKELSIQDIPFRITKFCPRERPVIKRNIETGGERANLEGSIYDKLRNGETIIVPENWVYELPIGVDYIEGMPLSNCPLGFYEDNDGNCNQRIYEEIDIPEIIQNITTIEVGKEDVFFENSILIADKEFTSEKPEYLCEDEDPKANSPNPRPTCWTVDVSYNGQGFDFFYGEEKYFNGLFKIIALPIARYKDGEVIEYTNKFLLSVTGDILEPEMIPDDDYYLIFGEPKVINFKLTNNLGDFPTNKAGYIVKTREYLLTGEIPEIINVGFNEGIKEYSVNVNTNRYGKVLYEIIFRYKIGDKTFYDNKVIQRNFEIVDKNPLEELEDAIAEINELTATIQEKAEIIKELTNIKNEQLQIVKELELSIEETAQLITELEFSLQQQVEYINQLEENLEYKAELINSLTANNEEQAELIRLMKLSFTEQAEIISELEKTIGDDAVIISLITDENDEQVQIVANLKRTLEEKEEIIKRLSDSVEEEKELTAKLYDELEKKEVVKKVPVWVWFALAFLVIGFTVLLLKLKK